MIFHIKNPVRLAIQCSVFALLFLLHFTGAPIVSIRSASPFLLLPMLTAYSMFNDELPSCIVGAVMGACVDSVSASPGCFNTITLLLVCVGTSFISKYLFNINARSAIVLSVLGNAFYYILKWLVCYAFSTPITDSLIYIFEYALPAVVFNAIFVVGFYFMEKRIYKNRVK